MFRSTLSYIWGLRSAWATWDSIFRKKKFLWETGEMVQWLRALSAFQGTRVLFPAPTCKQPQSQGVPWPLLPSAVVRLTGDTQTYTQARHIKK